MQDPVSEDGYIQQAGSRPEVVRKAVGYGYSACADHVCVLSMHNILTVIIV
jgi:hypothetical protein